MKKAVFLVSIVSISSALVSWGIFGHEHINKAAVMALPQPVQTFFYNHIDFMTQESTVPDLRKYTLADKAEHPRHFIDLENFGSLDSLPKTLADVKTKYDEKTLAQNGFLPWYMEEMMDKLTKSMKEKRKTEILFLAADLGHYMGDAHMPMHTTANHDGQKTNQRGIHALWEAQLPEAFGAAYNFHTNEAKYITDVHAEIWRIIFESHRLVDTILAADSKIRKLIPEDKMYKKDPNGKVIKNKFNSSVFTDEYTKALHSALNGMVEKQLQLSIQDVSNFWYTAWVNAGKPDLNALDSPDISKRNNKQFQEDMKLWKKGQLFGMEGEKEF